MGTNTMALIQTCQNSGHQKCSTKAVFLCAADKLQVATCWHVELGTFSLLHLSFNIHSCNRFRSFIMFFHLKIDLGLALGESWLLLAQLQKNTCVQRLSTFSYFRGKAFLGKPAKIILSTNYNPGTSHSRPLVVAGIKDHLGRN